MKIYFMLLTTVLTIFSCGEKAWEGCGGAEYTASVEESETIFKAESSSYDGFHCPAMEDAWPGTDSQVVVDYFIGTYMAQKAFVLRNNYEEIPLDELPFEELDLWREFTIDSLLSCEVGVAQPGQECADVFSLVFKSDKLMNFIIHTSHENPRDFYHSGEVADTDFLIMSGSIPSYLNGLESDLSFSLIYKVEGEEYDKIILAYDKK